MHHGRPLAWNIYNIYMLLGWDLKSIISIKIAPFYSGWFSSLSLFFMLKIYIYTFLPWANTILSLLLCICSRLAWFIRVGCSIIVQYLKLVLFFALSTSYYGCTLLMHQFIVILSCFHPLLISNAVYCNFLSS